jgi:hypothetical protein
VDGSTFCGANTNLQDGKCVSTPEYKISLSNCQQHECPAGYDLVTDRNTCSEYAETFMPERRWQEGSINSLYPGCNLFRNQAESFVYLNDKTTDHIAQNHVGKHMGQCSVLCKRS